MFLKFREKKVSSDLALMATTALNCPIACLNSPRILTTWPWLYPAGTKLNATVTWTMMMAFAHLHWQWHH